MSNCQHYDVRFVPEPGVPFRLGREVCMTCGAERVVEGDHFGQWTPAGGAPDAGR